jgi:hypothetical protein
VRISNGAASGYAARREPFTNTNQTMYGAWTAEDTYTVFSYGGHYPMYVWTAGRWYENSSGYSVTTRRHHTQARPCQDTTEMDTEFMRTLSREGYPALAARRLRGGKV